jgi:hypothetical protein
MGGVNFSKDRSKAMNDLKKLPKLPLAIVGAVVLIFVLLQFIPWQGLALIAFAAVLIFAFLGHLRLQVEKEQQQAAIPVYHPPQQQAQEPTTPTPTTPQPGFNLTATEYNQLAKQYQQGYQATTPPQRKYEDAAQPKESSPFDYEQPQATYPEQLPPMTTH